MSRFNQVLGSIRAGVRMIRHTFCYRTFSAAPLTISRASTRPSRTRVSRTSGPARARRMRRAGRTVTTGTDSFGRIRWERQCRPAAVAFVQVCGRASQACVQLALQSTRFCVECLRETPSLRGISTAVSSLKLLGKLAWHLEGTLCASFRYDSHLADC
jgi:hypothetical protein